MSDGFKVIPAFDYDSSTIIKPLTTNFDQAHRLSMRTTPVIINSADRNVDVYTTPADYVTELFEDIQDVVSVELKLAVLSFNPYNVTMNNNKLRINTTNIQVPVGIHTGQSLASFLNAMPPPAADWQVTYDGITQHLMFSSSEVFQLVGSSNNTYLAGYVHRVLGFGPKTSQAIYDATRGAYILESQYILDLTPNNTIVMNIDAMNVKQSANNVFNKSFGIIPDKFVDKQLGDVYSVKKTFNPPLARIDRLHIRFQDIWGNKYDFQNRDHILEFNFESQRNIRKYQSFIA